MDLFTALLAAAEAASCSMDEETDDPVGLEPHYTAGPLLAEVARGHQQYGVARLGQPAKAAGRPPAAKTGNNKRRREPAGKSSMPGGPCSHCGVADSPQWRRPLDRDQVLCNACGIYWGRHHRLPPHKKALFAPPSPATVAAGPTGSVPTLLVLQAQVQGSPMVSTTTMSPTTAPVVAPAVAPPSPLSPAAAPAPLTASNGLAASTDILLRPLPAVRTRCTPANSGDSSLSSRHVMRSSLAGDEVSDQHTLYPMSATRQPAAKRARMGPQPVPVTVTSEVVEGDEPTPKSNGGAAVHSRALVAAAGHLAAAAVSLAAVLHQPGSSADTPVTAEGGATLSAPMHLAVQRVQAAPGMRRRSPAVSTCLLLPVLPGGVLGQPITGSSQPSPAVSSSPLPAPVAPGFPPVRGTSPAAVGDAVPPALHSSSNPILLSARRTTGPRRQGSVVASM